MGGCGRSVCDGGGVGYSVARPVKPVIVMQVHQDGHWLTQDDTAPHNHVSYLASGKG